MISAKPSTSDLINDHHYHLLKAYILELTGLAYYTDKDEELCGRLARRWMECKVTSCEQYLELLRTDTHGKAELDHLVELLTVGETSFFRHAEIFEGLRSQAIPDILARNASTKRLRIWSAGCSIGAEAYSIAIVLSEHFGPQLEEWEVSILGTDINRHFLARAAHGAFRHWDLRGVQPPQLENCFTRHHDEWMIRPEYRKWVNFQYHNLVLHNFPSLISNLVAFDLILCRNVLIYFGRNVIDRLIPQFYDSLVDQGWLLVGHAEPNIELFRRFRTVNVPGAVLYQKDDATSEKPEYAMSFNSPVIDVNAPIVVETPPSETASDVSTSWNEPEPASWMLRRQSKPWPSVEHKRTVLAPEAPTDEIATLVRCADAGNLDVALQGFEQLVAENPMTPIYHLQIGMIAEQLGRRDQAEQALRRTLYLDPSNAVGHYYLGLLQQRHGEVSRAERSFQNAMKCLDDLTEDDTVEAVEGLSVSELRELARMQLEVVGRT